MTAYCLSSTSRSRPTVFTIAMMGGDERVPQQPIPPGYSVDTPDDDPLDQSNTDEQGSPLLRPSKKRIPEEEHGIP